MKPLMQLWAALLLGSTIVASAELLDRLHEYGDAATTPSPNPAGRVHGADFANATAGEYSITAGGEDFWSTSDHGTFISGDVFDSSVTRGEPAEFPVSGVIAGWTEALQLMPVGSKWRLFVPQHLAYGERGAGAAIPPYSTLVFEVELLDII